MSFLIHFLPPRLFLGVRLNANGCLIFAVCREARRGVHTLNTRDPSRGTRVRSSHSAISSNRDAVRSAVQAVHNAFLHVLPSQGEVQTGKLRRSVHSCTMSPRWLFEGYIFFFLSHVTGMWSVHRYSQLIPFLLSFLLFNFA